MSETKLQYESEWELKFAETRQKTFVGYQCLNSCGRQGKEETAYVSSW